MNFIKILNYFLKKQNPFKLCIILTENTKFPISGE